MKGAMDTYPLHFPSNAEVKHAITAWNKMWNIHRILSLHVTWLEEVCTLQYSSACEDCYGVAIVLFVINLNTCTITWNGHSLHHVCPFCSGY